MIDWQPGFHPRRGWLNDPHGITWHDGAYHLFFQHHPDSLVWRPDVCWGHATSPDLLTWTELEPVLEPDADDVGCWTGCLVDAAGHPPTILYTAAVDASGRGRIRSAVPLDESWSRWRKGDVAVPVPAEATDFRDPSVVSTPDGLRMLVGAGFADGTPAVLSFASRDLVTWTADGVFASGPASAPGPDGTRRSLGDVWECPQLVELDGCSVLLVSVQERGVGRGIAYRVEDGPWRWLSAVDTSGAPYAASVFHDQHGRPALMAWLRDATDGRTWAGALSVPYLLRLDDGGELDLREWTVRPARDR